MSSIFDGLDDQLLNLTRDGQDTTCAVTQWDRGGFFQYVLDGVYPISEIDLLLTERQDDPYSISVTVSKASEKSKPKECEMLMDDPTGNWVTKRKARVVCDRGTSGDVILVKDLRTTNEFFSICEVTIRSVLLDDSNKKKELQKSTETNEFDLNHLYMGLGVLALLILLIVVILLIVRCVKRRNTWSAQNDTRRTSYPRMPSHCQVAFPLPRDASLLLATPLRHLEGGRNSATANHYSVAVIPGENNQYLSIVGDASNAEHLYEDCFSGCSDDLYADCMVVPRPLPQPPQTTFSPLTTFQNLPNSFLHMHK